VKQIVVLGAGFAGLIAAVGAARKLAELGISRNEVSVTVVNRDPWHAIRVRNYETDLSDVRVPLVDVLGPIAVDLVIGDVSAVDCGRHEVLFNAANRSVALSYDRLVFALGSELVRPPIPGLAEYAFDIDTYDAAAKLGAHLAGLPDRPESPGRFTALVVGAGLTGVEAATELATRLRELANGAPARIILADRSRRVGSNMGEGACAVIEEALRSLDIEARAGVTIAAVTERGARLSSGEEIAAVTVVLVRRDAGASADGLSAGSARPLRTYRSRSIPEGRGLRGCLCRRDSAAAPIDAAHVSVMSCQHARPMGRIAGHNVVCDLIGEPMLPLDIGTYVTILDLGAWGAVYTEGGTAGLP
jgi:NADH:ubiquinone reductase (H+-translocating)